MVITPSDIDGVDEGTARRVIVLARTIAPCLDSLVDGPGDDDPKPKSEAIAILNGVAADVVVRGSRAVASQSIGPARVNYVVTLSSFSNDDRVSLRSLCAVETRQGLPMGSFPEAGALSRVWPEGTYSS